MLSVKVGKTVNANFKIVGRPDMESNPDFLIQKQKLYALGHLNQPCGHPAGVVTVTQYYAVLLIYIQYCCRNNAANIDTVFRFPESCNDARIFNSIVYAKNRNYCELFLAYGNMSCIDHCYEINQTWATYGPRDHFMRPAGTCRNINSFRESSRRPFIFYKTSTDK